MTTRAVQIATAAHNLGARIDRDPGDLLSPCPAEAAFDPDRAYRYLLTRTWSTADPVTFVLLNPSTADAFTLDPTVRRLIGFAHAWGAGGIILANAFALRATDPGTLYGHPDPVGPLNDALLDALPIGVRTVVAWGVHGVLHERGARVATRLREHGHDLHCFGRTTAGHPRHPLYLRNGTTPLPYPTAA